MMTKMVMLNLRVRPAGEPCCVTFLVLVVLVLVLALALVLPAQVLVQALAQALAALLNSRAREGKQAAAAAPVQRSRRGSPSWTPSQ